MNESRILARWIVDSRWEELPPAVRHETKRAFVNWIGNPIWGARDVVMERTLAALDPFSGPREAALLGRPERIDPFKAALINCAASSIADYDDTHLETVIHPTGPAASALLALAERHRMSGPEFLHALALAIEVECRVAKALAAAPARVNVAWYMTGVVGGIGAAASAGRVLGLDQDRMLNAIAIAAARAAGSRETHGTMAKNLVAACAAEDGLFAAFLARAGVLAPEAPIEGKRGLGVLVADGADYTAMTAGLGQSFELMRNAYKPYPSGIVTHAAITGALELARDHAPAPEAIRAVRLTVHPLCLELCGRRAPKDRIEGTFSVYHWVAVALRDRAIVIRQFSDATIADPAVIAVRDRIEARAEPHYRRDEAEIELTLADGTILRRHVDHAAGAFERPPSDADLDAKLADLVEGVLPPARGQALRNLCWRLDDAPDAAAILTEAAGAR